MRLTPLLLPLVAAVGCAVPSAVPAPGPTIAVHGAWAVTVLDPDGRVAATHRFHNDFADTNGVVTDVLIGGRAMGLWTLAVDGDLGMCDPDSSRCWVHEPGFPTLVDPEWSLPTLTVSTSPPGILSLEGSFVAAVASEIDTVGSIYATCPPTEAPQTCTYESVFVNAAEALTRRDGLSIPIGAGQQGVVSVEITFGAAQ